MTKFTILWPLLLVAVLALVWAQIGLGAGETDKQKETANNKEEIPPFPSMFFNSHNGGQSLRQIGKLVAETSSLGGPLIAQEEYIDLEQGKFALVQSNTQETLYVSAHHELILKYRPYTCDSFAQSAELYAQDMDNFNTLRNIDHPNGPTKALKVYGLMGLWLEADYAAKSFSRITHNYGVEGYEKSERVYQMSINRIPNHTVEFIFNDAMILESVTVTRESDRLVVKRYSILSMDFGLDQIKEDILEVPAGYDCSQYLIPQSKTETTPNGVDQEGDSEEVNSNFVDQYLWSDARVKLEVTATKFGTEQQQQPSAVFTAGATRASSVDTIYLELAHANALYSMGPVVDKEQVNGLVMVKIKSKRQETRTIWNHHYDVRYHIDSRLGQCTMSHLEYKEPDDMGAIIMEDEERDDLELEFANGLKFPMHKRQIESLFNSDILLGNFRVLKKISRPSSDNTQLIDYYIMERPQQAETKSATTSTTGGRTRWVRILATVVVVTDVPSGQEISREVESFTIWLMAPEQTWIEESYQFSVVKKDFPLEIYPDVAQLFDVSEECYLSDASKKSGLDYAWTQLFYPISSKRLNMLIENELQLKQAIYKALISTNLISLMSLPRLELMFSDEGLFVRFLLLDLPQFNLIFDSRQGIKLADDKSYALLSFKLPDERHCARMCQLHDCLTMSFCPQSRSCVLSRSPANLDGARKSNSKATTDPHNEPLDFEWAQVQKMANCVTYSHSKPALIRELRQQRLANVIAVLQNQDYDNLNLPQMADELALPREETNISEIEYNKLLHDYFTTISEFMIKHGDRIPSLLLSLVIEGHFIVVLPTKFHVEDNPLEQFYLSSTSNANELGADIELQDPKQIVQFFHTGLTGTCIDMGAFNEQLLSAHKDLDGDGATNLADAKRVMLQTFAGLTYDQCALACLDSSCGVFSHCATSLNCVISNMHTIEEARRLKYIRDDNDCLIAQRDYAQHFQQYSQVKRPRKWSKDITVTTSNDCATSCVIESDFNCYAFEFCDSLNQPNCFLQDQRQRDKLSVAPKGMGKQKGGPGETAGKVGNKSVTCDHYERDYLAEFTQINLHSFKHEVSNHYDSLEYFGLTSFECADNCLNQVDDCSAFEFCFRPIFDNEKDSHRYEQTCTLIRQKQSDKFEDISFVVGDTNQLDVETKSKLEFNQWPLEYSPRCHVFALKPNTVQAHLRNLALGQTMTRHELEQEQARQGALGVGFSWSSLFLLVLTLVSVSAVLGFGLSWARERNGSVRHRLDRLEAAIRQPFGRFASANSSSSLGPTLPSMEENHQERE